MAAQGEATARVGALGGDVDVVVMAGAPRLLSAGQLVESGHGLQWGQAGCVPATPAGMTVALRIADGIPVLPDTPQAWPGRGGPRAVAPLGAVRDGVASSHQQEGHYPWRSECAFCSDAAIRHDQHRRRLPHAGVLAVDLAALGTTGPRVLVGATQMPG